MLCLDSRLNWHINFKKAELQGALPDLGQGPLVYGKAAHKKRPVPVPQDGACVPRGAGITGLLEQRAQLFAHTAPLRADAVAGQSARAQEIGC